MHLVSVGLLTLWLVAQNGNGRNVDSSWDDMEFGRILTEHMRSSKVSSLVHKLKGLWPFDDERKCKARQTRDVDYLRYILNGRGVGGKLTRVRSCGKNQLTETEERSRAAADAVNHHSKKEQKNDVSGRVIGGKLVAAGSWPWLAAVGTKVKGPRCGGSLIADRWVITAAHCFKDLEAPCKYNVRIGSSNWLTDTDQHHIDVTVSAIYRHPNYEGGSMVNDVALLKLSSPVKLNENGFINAICLPTRAHSAKVGDVCLAAGWGKISEESITGVLEAREVEIPILSYRDPCGQYGEGWIHPGQICAGYLKGGRDACQGDSGGPLIQRRNGRWTLIGLTSFGQGCARAGYPGVYTDVGYYLEWINSVMNRY